ncbi:RdgB/HAM1 family non-canonical purine NTP pyrophosphatase [Thermomicrobiaceae bacterium CFH 74404]|uniref:dITP/XTP pyrophosphatase n=1 Tax=Thermalbibacter longus TaxID=2951981 RepID=A0AA41WBK6_9BACT|nr:RdgB/HAM1 family non-canonical purine NTP pyrophosphatase [Thermalbibacter longus]MCM8750049.1 RdgB/HAM1 family non-canonical purine NTP pyrophosphatase [Thermalbibacter longus]
MTKRRIVLASSNPGKLRELQSLLPPEVEVVSAAEAGVTLPPETGSTFAENALLKARAAAQQSGLIAIADDSGLEVDALGGEPGVRSARYAGPRASDAANIALLLNRLDGVPEGRRTARFRAVVALVVPDGSEFLGEGVLEGQIVHAPRGQGGFGYDPVFQPLGENRTVAEMTLEEKNRVSHRAQALRQVIEALHAWLDREESSERAASAGEPDGRDKDDGGIP